MSIMLKKVIKKLADGVSLSEEEAMGAMECIMQGEATPAQIGSFITALRLKGETIDEITGCARVMRNKAERIEPAAAYCIDTCGTGGDGSNTFNISTAAAVVAAAGGVTVAKHGNRSVSSRSGSADVLEALGVNISLAPYEVKSCIDNVGIGFMFAPVFHKSMSYASGPRKELGIRTIFNILGPLTNPAVVKGQVLGVFNAELAEQAANVLLRLGVERAMVIHGEDGLDEITTTGMTQVVEVIDGQILKYQIDPEQLGFTRVEIGELSGGDSAKNADIIRSIFQGVKGPKRDVVVVNAAASLYIGKAAVSLEEGLEIAADIIDSGLAEQKLKEFAEYTNLNDRKAGRETAL